MKKLFCLIVPLLLLFGVSFGDTWTFNYTWSSSSSWSSSRQASNYFVIIWSTWNYVNLYSFTVLWSWNTCDRWAIFDESDSLLISWSLSTTSTSSLQTIYPNLSLTPWFYAIQQYHSAWSACYRWRWATNSIMFPENFSPIFIFRATTASTYWTPFNNSLISYTISDSTLAQIVFSWTDPRIGQPTPITIWYNWTWMTFAGSNIYLTDLFHNYTMSGSDIIFTPYVYRALFRSH